MAGDVQHEAAVGETRVIMDGAATVHLGKAGSVRYCSCLNFCARSGVIGPLVLKSGVFCARVGVFGRARSDEDTTKI